MQTEDEVKEYTRFRKNIMKLGFYQIQFSIYVKVVLNEAGYKTVFRRIQNEIPTSGNIRIIKVTEKQYEDMIFLRGMSNLHEEIIGDNNVVVFREREENED